eukprot:c26309_g1_i1 orf=355-513(+)
MPITSHQIYFSSPSHICVLYASSSSTLHPDSALMRMIFIFCVFSSGKIPSIR